MANAVADFFVFLQLHCQCCQLENLHETCSFLKMVIGNPVQFQTFIFPSRLPFSGCQNAELRPFVLQGLCHQAFHHFGQRQEHQRSHLSVLSRTYWTRRWWWFSCQLFCEIRRPSQAFGRARCSWFVSTEIARSYTNERPEL